MVIHVRHQTDMCYTTKTPGIIAIVNSYSMLSLYFSFAILSTSLIRVYIIVRIFQCKSGLGTYLLVCSAYMYCCL